MPASTLVIQKLIVDVYIDEHPQPVVLLNDTSRALTQLVLPLIEQELERIRLPEQSVKIHTMEVEVKSDSLHTWKRDFSTTITKSITEACDQIVSVAGHQPARGALPNQDFSLTGEAIAVSEQEQLLALLCFFMLKGYLPWWK